MAFFSPSSLIYLPLLQLNLFIYLWTVADARVAPRDIPRAAPRERRPRRCAGRGQFPGADSSAGWMSSARSGREGSAIWHVFMMHTPPSRLPDLT